MKINKIILTIILSIIFLFGMELITQATSWPEPVDWTGYSYKSSGNGTLTWGYQDINGKYYPKVATISGGKVTLSKSSGTFHGMGAYKRDFTNTTLFNAIKNCICLEHDTKLGIGNGFVVYGRVIFNENSMTVYKFSNGIVKTTNTYSYSSTSEPGASGAKFAYLQNSLDEIIKGDGKNSNGYYYRSLLQRTMWYWRGKGTLYSFYNKLGFSKQMSSTGKNVISGLLDSDEENIENLYKAAVAYQSVAANYTSPTTSTSEVDYKSDNTNSKRRS